MAKEMSDLETCPIHWQKTLLSENTSKCNKVHLAVGLKSRGYWLEWAWEPDTIGGMRRPVRFRFKPDGKWIDSKCFDDVYQAMKDPSKKAG